MLPVPPYCRRFQHPHPCGHDAVEGYADDLPLKQWLEDYIWPYEDKLTPDDIRRGSEIACREMASSGSTFFSDMYFDIEETVSVVDRSGMRAAIGITVMENHSKAVEARKKDFIMNWSDPTGGRIQLVMAPHAIYTVGTTKLRKAAEFARRHGSSSISTLRKRVKRWKTA